MPTPRKGERTSDYISRCMETPDLQDKPVKQRLGQCYGMLRSHRAKLRRKKSILPPGYSYKLAPSAYGLDVVAPISDGALFDDHAMSITVPFAATHGRDRVGDLLEVSGILTANHIRNPVAFADHGKNFPLPIGKCESPDGKYTVFIDPEQGLATATIYLTQATKPDGSLTEAAEVAWEIFQLWKERILRAGSIGYRPMKSARLPPDQDSGLPPGLHLQQVELLEVSIVGLPCNQDAVSKLRKILDAGQVCGKSLTAGLRKILEPMADIRFRSSLVRTTDMPSATRRRKDYAAAASPAMSAVDSSTGGDLAGAQDAIPHGARVLGDVHGALGMVKELIGQHRPLLDHEGVKGYLDKLEPDLDKHRDGAKSLFTKSYPDLEGLEEDEEEEERKPEEEEEGGPDEKEEEEGDEEMKALVSYIRKTYPLQLRNGKTGRRSNLAARINTAVQKALGKIGRKQVDTSPEDQSGLSSGGDTVQDVARYLEEAAEKLAEHAASCSENAKMCTAHAKALRGYRTKDDTGGAAPEGGGMGGGESGDLMKALEGFDKGLSDKIAATETKLQQATGR